MRLELESNTTHLFFIFIVGTVACLVADRAVAARGCHAVTRGSSRLGVMVCRMNRDEPCSVRPLLQKQQPTVNSATARRPDNANVVAVTALPQVVVRSRNQLARTRSAGKVGCSAGRR